MKKRILIPYATYGTGHRSVAEYIKEYFEKNGEYECLAIDVLSYAAPFLTNIAKSVSKTMMTKMPDIFTVFYALANNRPSATIFEDISVFFLKNKKLEQEIRDFNPDLTIATHFLGSDLIADYNKRGITNSKIVTVVTDYETHAFWQKNRKVDALILANEKEKLRLMDKGFREDQLFVSGIPIAVNMDMDYDRDALIEKFGIDKNLVTVMFFGGGGDGSTWNLRFFKAILENDYPCNVLFIAGKSDSAFKIANKYVEKYEAKNAKVFGYVDVNDFYRVSDFVITKPGGAQVTECLFLSKPMLLVKGNGGQENANKKYLVENGYAESATMKGDFLDAFEKLLYNDRLRERMSAKIDEKNQREAIVRLFDFINKMMN